MPAGGVADEALHSLLEHAGVWRGKQQLHSLPTAASGHAKLDRYLPGGGWPCGALTELMAARPGLGEFHLLLPALARVTERSWAILIDPPWTPYAPALKGHGVNLERLLLVRTRNAAESLWACEQALSSTDNGAVLSWLDSQHRQADFSHLRRLQLAARQGRKLAFAFRPASMAGRASPAALRLYLSGSRQPELHITLIKCRGARQGEQLSLRRCTHRLPWIPATNVETRSSESRAASLSMPGPGACAQHQKLL